MTLQLFLCFLGCFEIGQNKKHKYKYYLLVIKKCVYSRVRYTREGHDNVADKVKNMGTIYWGRCFSGHLSIGIETGLVVIEAFMILVATIYKILDVYLIFPFSKNRIDLFEFL